MNSLFQMPGHDAWDTCSSRFAGYAHAALARRDYGDGQRILDVSCGSGGSTFRVAGHAGPDSEVVGIDRSASAIRRAEAMRAASGFENVIFLQRDAQADELGGPYDHVFSLFGTMGFDRPDRFLRNVRQSLRPGGTCTQVVWRRLADNPWAERAFRSVRTMFGVASLPEHAESTGVFSMADADVVADRLTRAGFHGILLERHDCEVRIGTHLAEAVDFTAGYGPVAQLLALLGNEAASRGEEIYAALAGALLPYIKPGGVWVPSSAWLVGAERGR